MRDKRTVTISVSLALVVALSATLFVGSLRSLAIGEALGRAYTPESLQEYLGKPVEFDEDACNFAATGAASKIASSSASRRLASELEEFQATFTDGLPSEESFEWFRDSDTTQSIGTDFTQWGRTALSREVQEILQLNLDEVIEQALQEGSEKELESQLSFLRASRQLPPEVTTTRWASSLLPEFTRECLVDVKQAVDDSADAYKQDSAKFADLVLELARSNWQSEGYSKVAPLVAYAERKGNCGTSQPCVTLWILTPVECTVNLVVEFSDDNGKVVDTAYKNILEVGANTRKSAEVQSSSLETSFYNILEASCF